MQKIPSLSIIIEWENAKNADARRGRAMLAALTAQLLALAQEQPVIVELILIHDAAETDPAVMEADLKPIVASFPGSVMFAPCHDLDYYEQKNFGAGLARHDAILLLDCDVVPTPNWLRNLLDCYVAEGADLVCGATHMEQRTLYEKAFALFWFFPLASEVTQRRQTNRFFANNVVIRAEMLKSRPFPTSRLVRGKCRLLAETLIADQRVLMLEPTAKVIHPPPNGLRHFIKRALCSGHDDAMNNGYDGLRPAFWRYRSQLKHAARRILDHRREVDLGRLGAVSAIAVAAAYYGLIFTGEAISQINPHIIRNRLRV
jgi:glycosyltransferase involved in cell wall biosynthesis